MNEKTCIVTGATSGLGLETARELSGRGATVVLLGRNPEKGKAAMEDIRAGQPDARLEFLAVDVSAQQQIREVAGKISARYPRVDVLVNNAGTWFSKRTFTEDGIEAVFAVNHLAYFLLTHLLYPNLRRSEDARVVNVGSDSHFQVKGMYFNDLYLEKNYHGLRSYAQSKLANILFTYELHRRKPDEHLSVNCVQPGLVKTDIGVKHTTWLHKLAWKLRRSSGVEPAEGARTQIYLAASEEAKGMSGLYFDDCKPKRSSRASYDEAAAARLWEVSKEMCGIEDYFSPSDH
ncbi:MAG: SDR family oxidoreductase [Phaeodactylibacter sp.]|nr:SDR family oxidoreductase [Phaeodactylibacter sp.]